MSALSLWVPGLRDMEYRQRLLADPATMAYNRGLDLGGAEGYDPDTGCIAFPREDWCYWRGVWLRNEPEFFSALLRDEARGCFVGEVTYHWDGDLRAHVAGVIIEAKHRGRGLGSEGLRLLADHAFRRDDIALLARPLSADDLPALKACAKAGFHRYGEAGGMVQLMMTREEWERGRP